MPYAPARPILLAPWLGLVALAVALASPAEALEPCSQEMCVCGDQSMAGADGVVEGRVLTDRPSDHSVDAIEVEVVAVHGTAAEHWDVGDVLTTRTRPPEPSVGLAVNEDVLVLTVGEWAAFIQRLDASGPVCFHEPLPLTTAEAVELALRKDCAEALESRFPDRQLEPPCGDPRGCATAGGGAVFLALGLLVAALVFRALPGGRARRADKGAVLF